MKRLLSALIGFVLGGGSAVAVLLFAPIAPEPPPFCGEVDASHYASLEAMGGGHT